VDEPGSELALALGLRPGEYRVLFVVHRREPVKLERPLAKLEHVDLEVGSGEHSHRSASVLIRSGAFRERVSVTLRGNPNKPLPLPPPSCETLLEGLEEARPHALEVAQKAYAETHAGTEDAKALGRIFHRSGPTTSRPLSTRSDALLLRSDGSVTSILGVGPTARGRSYQPRRSSFRASLVVFFHSR
jgi:hypothetical protein